MPTNPLNSQFLISENAPGEEEKHQKTLAFATHLKTKVGLRSFLNRNLNEILHALSEEYFDISNPSDLR